MQFDTMTTGKSQTEKSMKMFLTVARPTGGRDFVTKTLEPGPNGSLVKRIFTLRDGTTASIKPAKRFECIERVHFGSFGEMAAVVRSIAEARDAYLLRAAPDGDRAPQCVRSQATLPEMSNLLALDLDGFPLPPDKEADPANGVAIDDAEGIGEALRAGLPGALRDAAFLVQLTSGHGLSGDGRVHLLFGTERPVSRREVLALLGGREPAVVLPWTGEAFPLDASTLRGTQPVYIGDPIVDGAVDPYAGRRWGVCVSDPLEDGWVRVPPADMLEAEACRLLGPKATRLERVAGAVDEERAERRLRGWLNGIATPVAKGSRHLTLSRAWHRGLDFGVDPDVCAAVVAEWADGDRSIYGEDPVPNLAEPLDCDVEAWIATWSGSREDPIGWDTGDGDGDDSTGAGTSAAVEGVEGAFPSLMPEDVDHDVPEDDATLVQGLMAFGKTTVIFGPSHSGKSTVAYAIVENIAMGRPVAGLATEKSGIWWAALEDDTGARKRQRLGQHLAGHHLPMTIFDGGRLQLPSVAGSSAAIEKLADRIVATMKRDGAMLGTAFRVAVFDSWLELLNAELDDNDPRQMRQGLRLAKALERRGVAVILIAHTGKDEARGVRGAKVMEDYATTYLEVRADGLFVRKNKAGRVAKGTTFKYDTIDTEVPWPVTDLPVGGAFKGVPRVEWRAAERAAVEKGRGRRHVAEPKADTDVGEAMTALRGASGMRLDAIVDAVTTARTERGVEVPDRAKLRKSIDAGLVRWRGKGLVDVVNGVWSMADGPIGYGGIDTEGEV